MSLEFRPSNSISPSGNLADNWRLWKQRFNLFMMATESDAKVDNIKIASIGLDALERYNHITFDEAAGEDSKSYVQVMQKFEDHFNCLKRTVFSRYQFWTYRRAEQQPCVDYLTAIQNLADACEFAEKENMIRDNILFSIAPQEKALKERLLRQENLTLTKTRDLCVVFEVTQNEVKSMSTHDTRSTTEKAVNSVTRRRVKQDTKSTPFSQRSNQDTRHIRTTTVPPPVQTNTSYSDAAESSMKRASAQRTALRVTSATGETTTQQCVNLNQCTL